MSRSRFNYFFILLILFISLPIAEAAITESEFTGLIEQITSEYKQVVLNNGDRLDIVKFWKSNVINAHAKRMGNEIGITFHGGLARLPAMTPGMFVLVVCHELGHHLGGAPYSTPKDFMSAEGQADYFASSKCFRHMLKSHSEYFDFFDFTSVPFELEKECQPLKNDEIQFKICLASGLASRDLINALARLASAQFPGVDFSQKDSTTTKKTITSYPSAQCRMDTLMAGSVCSLPEDELPGRENNDQGNCTLETGHYSFEVRPACWYRERP